VSWVRGYGNVLAPMQRASTLFSEHLLAPGVSASHPRYRRALFHLLACETSCYRYWGQGTWTDYGAELARRASEAASSPACPDLARHPPPSPKLTLVRQDQVYGSGGAGRERNGDDFAAPPGLARTRQAGPSYMTQANISTGGSPGAASTRACIGVAILSALEAPSRPAS
jgi:hypothetical protein